MARRRSKYGVRQGRLGKLKRMAYGFLFDSELEKNRYLVLRAAEQEGRIRDLELQPKFVLQEKFRDRTGKMYRAITYTADFRYRLPGGHIVVEDTKGMRTPVFRLKMKLLLRRYPEIDFRLVERNQIGEIE